MNAETIAAIQSARLDFQGLLGRPFTFDDSPSINSPATREVTRAAAPATAPAAAETDPAPAGDTCGSCGATVNPHTGGCPWKCNADRAGAVAPAPAAKPTRRQKPRRRAQAAPGATIARQPLPPIAWEPDAF